MMHAAACLQHCAAELSRLRTQSGGPVDWASVYMTALQPLRLSDSATSRQAFAATLRTAAAAAVAAQAAALREAAVAEWTLRVRVSAGGADVQGWRVVVLLPTGAL